MKKFFKEFKEFATKGNVLDLAIGVIIGGAFQKIVSSVINDMIMPLIGLLTGNSNFNDQFIILKMPENVEASAITSLDVANKLGVTTFNYGSFLSSVLDFLIMTLIIFIMIKAINKVKNIAATEASKLNGKDAEEEEEAVPTVKTCPYCLSEVPYAAVKCAHCTSDIPI